jgi:hypothetical protein
MQGPRVERVRTQWRYFDVHLDVIECNGPKKSTEKTISFFLTKPGNFREHDRPLAPPKSSSLAIKLPSFSFRKTTAMTTRTVVTLGGKTYNRSDTLARAVKDILFKYADFPISLYNLFQFRRQRLD